MIKDYYIRTNTYAELEETLLYAGFVKDDNDRIVANQMGMAVYIIGDLPQQNPDGSIITTEETIDGEVVNVPVMQTKYHANVRVRGILNNLNNQIFPQHPLRQRL